MAKIAMILAIVVVIGIATCFTTHRICSTIDKTSSWNTEEHIVLRQDHEQLKKDHEALMRVSSDTNSKVTFLYNMVKNQNPDLK